MDRLFFLSVVTSECEILITGPSFALSTMCSSSFVALDHAVWDIRGGKCDDAIVTAVNICADPRISIQLNKLGMMSPVGLCKSFDASGQHRQQHRKSF